MHSEVIKGDGHLKQVGNGLNFKAERDQYYLVSTVYAQVPLLNSAEFDSQAYLTYYDIFKTNAFTVTYSGNKDDDLQEVIIRSVSRLILR